MYLSKGGPHVQMYVWKGVGIGRAGGVKNNPDLLTDIPTPVRVSECSSVQDQQLTRLWFWENLHK